MGVEREPAAVDTFEAVLVRVGRTHADHTLAEELVHLHAHLWLDLVVPLVALGIEDQAYPTKGVTVMDPEYVENIAALCSR